jgi:phosphate transport system substrate-binding protein
LINKMKKFNFITYFLIITIVFSSSITAQKQDDLKGEISISGAFALYPMVVKWADEFKKLHPKVRVDVSAGGAGKGITDVLSKVVDIGMVSRDIYPEETKKGAYTFAVTKDAVVPVISESNPAIQDLILKGLKLEVAKGIWITGKVTAWNQGFKVKNPSPIHIYTRSDAAGAAEVWAKYLGKKQEDLLGVGVFGDPGLATAVRNDPLGIGFNNIGYVYDQKTKKPNPGIRVLPLDLNNNGKIDADENFYATQDEIVNAIATGKYPSPPARDLYFVTSSKPVKKELVEFIKWVLTDGQKFVIESGYIKLSDEKISNELKKIN